LPPNGLENKIRPAGGRSSAGQGPGRSIQIREANLQRVRSGSPKVGTSRRDHTDPQSGSASVSKKWSFRASAHTGVGIPLLNATISTQKTQIPLKTRESPHQSADWFAMTDSFSTVSQIRRADLRESVRGRQIVLHRIRGTNASCGLDRSDTVMFAWSGVYQLCGSGLAKRGKVGIIE